MDRLTAQDLITLWPDLVGWPQDIGALAILDGSRPDAAERLGLDAVRSVVESRLQSVPRLRQVIHTPRRRLGLPLWIDAPAFDLGDHVRAAPVPAPGDEEQLLAVMEQLRRRPLGRSRPLWELWLLPGLHGGRVGLYLKMHHVVADGVAGVALLMAFLDTVPRAANTSPGSPWVPAPVPTDRDLREDTVRRRSVAVRRGLGAAGHPMDTLRRARAAGSAWRRALAEGRAPRSGINARIGSDRNFALVRTDLAEITRIAHEHGAKVNDVLLTAVCGGLRELLLARGETVEGVVLKAVVPVSLRRTPGDDVQGNLLGQMIVPLPIGVADAGRTLRLIAEQAATRKSGVRPRRVPVLHSERLQRAMMTLLARQRQYNTYVADVPGPALPLYLAGAPLLEVFPVVALMANVTIGVGALSYNGQLNITAVGDRDRCPDLGVFVHGARRAVLSLMTATASRDDVP